MLRHLAIALVTSTALLLAGATSGAASAAADDGRAPMRSACVMCW